MPTLHSHTITHDLFIFNGVREPQAVCQAAPANAPSQACQRVCLPLRSTKPTEKQTTEKNTERLTACIRNSGCSGKSKVCASKKLCAKWTGKRF